MKKLSIEPKLIDLGNNETKRDKDLIEYTNKTYKNVKKGLRTDSVDK